MYIKNIKSLPMIQFYYKLQFSEKYYVADFCQNYLKKGRVRAYAYSFPFIVKETPPRIAWNLGSVRILVYKLDMTKRRKLIRQNCRHRRSKIKLHEKKFGGAGLIDVKRMVIILSYEAF